jgi:aquaporin Z
MFNVKKLAAEFLGTAVLVFIAVGVATESFGFKTFGSSLAAGVVATALAFGLVLMALAYAIGPISGCHVNPAVTLGFMAAGRMKLDEAIGYVIAQVAGGLAGAAILWQIFSDVPGYSRKTQGLGTDGYGASSMVHLNQTGAFVTEVVLTFIFVTVILFATHKAAIQGAAGLAIGMSLVVVHLIGIPLTGTSVNPARSLGPALIVGGSSLSQVWLFIVAPLVGAVIAAAVHLLIAGREDIVVGTPAAETATTVS